MEFATVFSKDATDRSSTGGAPVAVPASRFLRKPIGLGIIQFSGCGSDGVRYAPVMFESCRHARDRASRRAVLRSGEPGSTGVVVAALCCRRPPESATSRQRLRAGTGILVGRDCRPD